MKRLLIVVTVLLGCFMAASAQKFEGLGDTPPMGWNSYNTFHVDVNETLIKEIADAMVETGLRDAGYIYVNIDDGWAGFRDSLGFIQPNPDLFPSGMKSLVDYIHSKGLKAGIYSDAQSLTCAKLIGSLGHEYQDAMQFAKWGFDYLKLDWNIIDRLDPIGAYTLMRNALRAAGRPVYFSICEWGRSEPWTWADSVGHQWRTTDDIYKCFDCMYEGWSPGVLQMIDKQVDLRKYAGPGHWNDPDMLEVGNLETAGQDRAHFTMWAMLAVPLILGNDVRNMTQETKEILTNREVIAIDQDRLGVQGLRFLQDDGLDFWFKPLVDGDWAFCILNRTTTSKEYTIDWQNFNLYDCVSKRFTDFDSKVYKIRNIWAKKEEGTSASEKKITVPGQDVLLFRLSLK